MLVKCTNIVRTKQVHCTNIFLYLGMKTERIGLRVSEEQLKKMEARAEALGLNLTAYINYCIAREMNDAAKASA